MSTGTDAETAGSVAAQIALRLDGEEHVIAARAGETIFAAAHRAGLPLPFSCIAGYCGECAATLESGAVRMEENRVLTEKQVARGRVLTCQAVPTTSRCRLRFDD